VAISQGVSFGVNTVFLPIDGGPTVDPLNAVQALPLLHGYTDPATGSPVIAVSSQFAQPPQITIYELPVDAGALPDSGLPDGGNSTDGGLPDGGLLSDSGWTQFGPAINSVDGGVVIEMLPLPVPLAGGGYGQRAVWTQASSIDVQADSAYVTDNTAGAFSAPMALVTQSSTVEDLVGAADTVGNGLAAWIEGANGFLSVASFSPGSSLPTVFSNIDPNTPAVSDLSALPLTVGPSTGFAVVEVTGSNTTGAHMVFLSDAGPFTFDVPIPEIDGGCAGLALAASTCNLSELAGGPGFCIAGGCVLSASETIIFAAAVSTSNGSPTVTGHNTLLDDLDAGLGIGPPAIVASPTGEVTVEWVDQSTGVPMLSFTQFDNLSQQNYPVTSVGSMAQIQDLTTPMPWRSNPLVLFSDQLGSVSSLALPGGTTPLQPISGYVSAGNVTQYNQPRAYVDPTDGRLILALQPYSLNTTSFDLFELPP
jgi:hypothetical protein